MSSVTLNLPRPFALTRGRPACVARPARQTPEVNGAARRPRTLWRVSAAYRWRLALTYGLSAVENLLRLAQPYLLGLAISDLLKSSPRGVCLFAAFYFAQVLAGT